MTVCTSVMLILMRISEHSNPATTGTERLVSQVVDLSEQYLEEARTTQDKIETMQLKSMTLSLLRFANVTLSHERLEHLVGYSVRRRIRHLEQDINRLRLSLSTPSS